MRTMITVAAATCIMACATTAEQRTETPDLIIRDFIAVGELEEVPHIRTGGHDGYARLTDYFVVYRARDGEFLFEFTRPCRELRDPSRVTPDTRFEARIRSGFDTLRGCRIAAIYALTDAQAEEVRTMGD